MTIALGVKSSPKDPRGPERERTRYRTRPTTTGGSPKKALTKTTIKRRPRKETIARTVPIGKLITVAAAVATNQLTEEQRERYRRLVAMRSVMDLDDDRKQVPGAGAIASAAELSALEKEEE